jgi:RimJ/RimL family protein N-acetyltransferase
VTLGIPGVHLHTTNLNQAAIRLYAKLGFELLSTRDTDIWSHVVKEPVENQAYGLRLSKS